MDREPAAPSEPILRILDAAANRAREALRVMEDAARFAFDDSHLTAQLKRLRHDLAAALAGLPMNQAMLARDTPGDVGVSIKTPAELHRSSVQDVLAANAKRLSEALRSLEEFAKTRSPQIAALLESLRYRGYSLEQGLMSAAAQQDGVDRFRGVRLYVLLTAALCSVRPGESADTAWQRALEEIVATASAASAGASICIQLREKNLPDAELLRRARIVADACRAAGVLSIINDRPDIALLSGADGIHVGQSDLPGDHVRRLVGPRLIVGVSTESLAQARQAVADGATYIAAGPMFPTTTKHKPRIAGPEYAAEAAAAIERPIVAIGGISLENVTELTSRGVRRIAVSSAILRCAEPARAIQAFLQALE